MANLLNFSKLHTTNAANNFSREQTAQEFDLIITCFVVLKYLAMAVSIASGYCFFYYKLAKFITGFANAEVIAAALAVFLLVCLELLIMALVKKSFKMAFKGEYLWMLGCVLISAFFIFISFNISIRGVYIAMSDDSKQQENICERFEDEEKAIRANTDEMRKSYIADIAEIKGPSWNSYALTTEQMRTRQHLRECIDSVLNLQRIQLESLEQRKALALSASQNSANTTAEDYTVYVIILLCIELFANAVCEFFQSRIFRDIEPVKAKAEVFNRFVDESREELSALFMSAMRQEQNNCLAAVTQAMKEADKQKKASPTSAQKKAAGFSVPQTPDNVQGVSGIADDEKGACSSAETSAAHVSGAVCHCALCGAEFKANTTWQKYCSEAHRYQYNANISGHVVRGIAPDYDTWPHITQR